MIRGFRLFRLSRGNSIPSASVGVDQKTSGRSDHWLLKLFPMGTVCVETILIKMDVLSQLSNSVNLTSAEF